MIHNIIFVGEKKVVNDICYTTSKFHLRPMKSLGIKIQHYMICKQINLNIEYFI